MGQECPPPRRLPPPRQIPGYAYSLVGLLIHVTDKLQYDTGVGAPSTLSGKIYLLENII